MDNLSIFVILISVIVLPVVVGVWWGTRKAKPQPFGLGTFLSSDPLPDVSSSSEGTHRIYGHEITFGGGGASDDWSGDDSGVTEVGGGGSDGGSND